MKNMFKLMKSRKITAYKLSADTKYSQGNICDWKHNRSVPNVSTLLKLSEYFGVSIDYLLDNPVTEQRRNSDDLLSYICGKTGLEKESVRDVLNCESEYINNGSFPSGE